MTNNEPIIQITQNGYLRLLTLAGEYFDDRFDEDMEFADFKKAYEDESDFELERKRKIMRNRTMDTHFDKEKKGLSLWFRHCLHVATNGPLEPVFSAPPTRC